MSDANLLDVWTHVLDPMRAEVRIRLRSPEPGTELRGRLMGPRSRFTTTIEVAYPIRPLGSTGEYAAIIPEPSLWEPARPFVYEGPIEWADRDGAPMEAWPRVCFRTVKLGPKGLLLNNKPLQVRGQYLTAGPESVAENDLLEWRRQGCNALLSDVGQAVISELADRLGFLLVLRDKPGENGQESFCCRLSSQTDGRIKLTGISRQADGSFTLA